MCTKNDPFHTTKKLFPTTRKITFQREKFNGSGVYKIYFNNWSNCYIGQTKRTFKSRFREHIQALKSSNKTYMKSFTEHLLDSNQSYTSMENNLMISELDKKGVSLNYKEDFHIYIKKKIKSIEFIKYFTHQKCKSDLRILYKD